MLSTRSWGRAMWARRSGSMSSWVSFGRSVAPPENSRYAAVQRDRVELHLQWQDAKEWERIGDRPTYRFVVADVDGLYREFRDAGVSENIKPVAETSWGTREFHLRDPDGNGLQFYRSL